MDTTASTRAFAAASASLVGETCLVFTESSANPTLWRPLPRMSTQAKKRRGADSGDQRWLAKQMLEIAVERNGIFVGLALGFEGNAQGNPFWPSLAVDDIDCSRTRSRESPGTNAVVDSVNDADFATSTPSIMERLSSIEEVQSMAAQSRMTDVERDMLRGELLALSPDQRFSLDGDQVDISNNPSEFARARWV